MAALSYLRPALRRTAAAVADLHISCPLAATAGVPSRLRRWPPQQRELPPTPLCPEASAPSTRSQASWRCVGRPRQPGLSLQHRGFASVSGVGVGGQDPYKVLGVQKNASESEIKAAYRKQALKWHPDRQPEDKRKQAEKQFNDVASAYELLSDPAKRRDYDSGGRHGCPNGGPGFPGGFQGGVHSQAAAEQMFREVFGQGGMDELFGQLFGGQAGPVVLRQGMEVQVRPDQRTVLEACRRCGIDSTNDMQRLRSLGRRAIVVKVDPADKSVKLEVEGVGQVWFGAQAVTPKMRQPGPSAGAGAFPGANFNFNVGGGQQVLSMHQERVRLPDGRIVTRVTRRVVRPDSTVATEVFETN